MNDGFQIDQMGFEQARTIIHNVLDNVIGNGVEPDCQLLYWYLRGIVRDMENDYILEAKQDLREAREKDTK